MAMPPSTIMLRATPSWEERKDSGAGQREPTAAVELATVAVGAMNAGENMWGAGGEAGGTGGGRRIVPPVVGAAAHALLLLLLLIIVIKVSPPDPAALQGNRGGGGGVPALCACLHAKGSGRAAALCNEASDEEEGATAAGNADGNAPPAIAGEEAWVEVYVHKKGDKGVVAEKEKEGPMEELPPPPPPPEAIT